ncbi:beta family protein [Frankia sp. AgB32]|uniref:beta family protein n=1 Tax=Frankia sp. AgB32 TaxID=631119 RepID=UPI00200E719D|nr:beta family protein [Frankia sp. AgB32]MCK9893410.1 beta family protein [Frankia sp. AgB32]
MLPAGLRYVPILRARRAEGRALQALPRQARSGLCPLLVIPGAAEDRRTKEPRKTVDEHLRGLVASIAACWTDSAFLDMPALEHERTAAGAHPLQCLVGELVEAGVKPIPATSPNRSAGYNVAVAALHHRYGMGICLRLAQDEWPSNDGGESVTDLLTTLGISRADVDLVLDLGTRAGDRAASVAVAFGAELSDLPSARSWRSITVAGTSFPSSLADLPVNLTCVERTEWISYLEVAAELRGLPLAFGDYAIANPEADARPWHGRYQSAFLRYTTGSQWVIGRSAAFYSAPDRQGVGAESMREVADLLHSSAYFAGPWHCPADAWIAAVADGDDKGGTPEIWRSHGTVHHLATVGEQLNDRFPRL